MNELTPFRDFNQDLFRVFDKLQNEMFTMLRNPNALVSSMDRSTFPKMNIKEKDKDLVFEIALPSYHPEDVEVSLDKDILKISGKVSSEYSNDADVYLVREVSHRAFSRSWKLPKPITEEQIEANYSNGVLKLVIKDVVSVASKPKSIPISLTSPKKDK